MHIANMATEQGRCYDRDFRQISAKKLAFFSKTDVMIKFLNTFALFWVKNDNFFADFFDENILKIITSVPALASRQIDTLWLPADPAGSPPCSSLLLDFNPFLSQPIKESHAGLPDGIFSYQKFQLLYTFEVPGVKKCGKFYGHLVYFMNILFILWSLGTFCGLRVYIFPALVRCANENLATLVSRPAAKLSHFFQNFWNKFFCVFVRQFRRIPHRAINATETSSLPPTLSSMWAHSINLQNPKPFANDLFSVQIFYRLFATLHTFKVTRFIWRKQQKTMIYKS
jgi:hypothetical protein